MALAFGVSCITLALALATSTTFDAVATLALVTALPFTPAVVDAGTSVTIDAPAADRLASKLDASAAFSVVVTLGRDVAPVAGSVIVIVVVSVPVPSPASMLLEVLFVPVATVELDVNVVGTSVALDNGRERVVFEERVVAMSPPVAPVTAMRVVASDWETQETY